MRKIVVIFVLSLTMGLCLVGLYRNKYYVKRFVKSHRLLYLPAKKIAALKHSLTQRFFSTKDPTGASLSAIEGSASFVFDAGQSPGRFERFWGNLGYESFVSGVLSGMNRRLFDEMKKTNQKTRGAFRYIRAHNLFSNGRPPWGEGCDIYHEDAAGRPYYDWTLTDQVFDRITQYGFKPIVEFGFMPDALASLPERRQKWGRGNISPPKDYQKWADLVYNTVQHLRQRYGEAELRSWYFEVWNEPDLGYLFWVEDPDPERKPFGDMREYHKLYDYTVQAAKRAFPQIRIGGPASAGGQISQLLEHVLLEKNYATGRVGTPIDFVSSHAYGKVGGAGSRKGENTVIGKILWKVGRAVKHDHPKVKRTARRLPFLLTETGPRNDKGLLYNTRYTAAWLVKLVDAVFFLGEKYGKAYQPREFVFWTSTQFGKNFDKDKGIASIVKVGRNSRMVKRPAYNAFEALGYLGNERLREVDESRFGGRTHAIATKAGPDSVAVIVYNLNEDDRENKNQDSVKVNLEVRDLPFRQFRVHWFVIDEMHSNGYAVWKRMGKPRRLTPLQFKQIDAHDDLELYQPVWQVNAAARVFKKSFSMQNNSVSLFVLTSSGDDNVSMNQGDE